MTKQKLIDVALFMETMQPNQVAFALGLSIDVLKNYLTMQARPPKVKAYKCLYFKEAE